MNEDVFFIDFGMKENDRFGWTHPQNFIISSLIIHHNSSKPFKLKVNKACLFSLFFANLEIFLLPTLTNPTYTFIKYRFIRGMSMIILYNVNPTDSLD